MGAKALDQTRKAKPAGCPLFIDDIGNTPCDRACQHQQHAGKRHRTIGNEKMLSRPAQASAQPAI